MDGRQHRGAEGEGGGGTTLTGLPVPGLNGDLSRADGLAATGALWEPVQGRAAPRLQGQVRLENSGGVVQVALELAPAGGAVDAASRAGTRTEVTGTGQACGPHLHTAAVTRPMAGQRPPW
ncbi:MAG: hypothetical protein IOD05_14530 [Rhodobacter sp.]|nr:hypothetical protein [Rhodobacter sp.]MCA3494980.1 hypothetical protein [Rhodobacter sp.]MCA3501506.1 hypothetical protein [Rhodobacter sp.]MCA3504430.1 hypothetical protein [Rhodobacter sp.]MCA3518370.1 hypothetical protein [Rhodobacter sp.]